MKTLKLIFVVAIVPASFAVNFWNNGEKVDREGPFRLSSPDHAKYGKPPNLTFTEGALRMNQIQVIGTHQSYHVPHETEIEKQRQKDMLNDEIAFAKLNASQPRIYDQLNEQNVRSLEFDLYVDGEHQWLPMTDIKASRQKGYYNYLYPWVTDEYDGKEMDTVEERYRRATPGLKCMNVPDLDVYSRHFVFRNGLPRIIDWMDENPEAPPLTIMINAQVSTGKWKAESLPWDQYQFKILDFLLLKSFGRDRIIAPDDLRFWNSGKADGTKYAPYDRNYTLSESLQERGWPDLESARGKVMFLLGNEYDSVFQHDNDARAKYMEDRPYLEDRVMFVDSRPGRPESAFIRMDDPGMDIDTREMHWKQIQQYVKDGMWVRTRADVFPYPYAGQRDAALRSGAQIVSTDYQFDGNGNLERGQVKVGHYEVTLQDEQQGGIKVPALCNPVNAPKGCINEEVEARPSH